MTIGLVWLAAMLYDGYHLLTKHSAWKQGFANDVYFMPMFDETDGYYEADEGVSLFVFKITCTVHLGLTLIQWWSYWGDLVDGLFSWETAWPPVGASDLSSIGDVSSEMAVMEAAYSKNKGYMMGKLRHLS